MTELPDVMLIENTGTSWPAPPTDVATTHPWQVEVICSPPEFTQFAFVLFQEPSERVVIRAVSRERLDEIIRKNNFQNHLRLQRMIVTGPDGFREETTREQAQAARDAARQQT